MNIYSKRKKYLYNLYFNAGRSIMSDCYRYMKQYINYSELNKIYLSVQSTPCNRIIRINDLYAAFFTLLCERIVNELFYCETVVVIYDSYFAGKVINQIIVPDKNIIICNNSTPFISQISCKVDTLYTTNCCKNMWQSMLIASDFFKKAYKNQ